MSLRPSRPVLISLLALTALGATGAWTWNRINSIPKHERARLGLVKAFLHSFEAEDRSFPTDEDRARLQPATEALIETLRAKYPALQIEDHPVPEAENGFLQLYRFATDYDAAKLPAAQELKELLAADPLNTDEAKRFLSQNAEWVARIDSIAALDKRSSANMPTGYRGFLSARPYKFAAEVLLLKARLAAEVRDEPEAQRMTLAALNLSSHLRQVEAPNLLGETVVVLIDLQVAKTTFQHVLPTLGREAHLLEWKGILSRRPYTPAAFAQVIRGEWDNTMRYLLFPVLVDSSSPHRPKDADKLARIMALHYSAWITRLHNLRLAEMRSDPGHAVPADLKNLSTKSRDLYEILTVGSATWSKGYLRASVIMAQHQAALDLLILEKNGTTLTRESAAKVTRDPVAEKPFDFDPATRTLTTSHGSDVTPLKLPF